MSTKELRDQAFLKYCSGDRLDNMTRVPISMIKSTMAKKHLYNRDFKAHGVVQHRCKGCCGDRARTLRKVRTEIIERDPRPSQWGYDVWLGIEPSADFYGFLFEAHAPCASM